MSAQQRMKLANEKASKNITQRGNVVKATVRVQLQATVVRKKYDEQKLNSINWRQELGSNRFRYVRCRHLPGMKNVSFL